MCWASSNTIIVIEKVKRKVLYSGKSVKWKKESRRNNREISTACPGTYSQSPGEAQSGMTRTTPMRKQYKGTSGKSTQWHEKNTASWKTTYSFRSCYCKYQQSSSLAKASTSEPPPMVLADAQTLHVHLRTAFTNSP